MVNQDALEEYSSSIKRLKRQCIEAGMSEEEFRKMYFETLSSIETENARRIPPLLIYRFKIVFYLVIVVCLCTAGIKFKYIYNCISGSMQEYIYPGLKMLRKLSIPFISLFPSLTELYYETCLIQNPFFTVVDMDCWPCSSVSNVAHIYEPKPVTEHHTAPFIYETDQEIIDVISLHKFYTNNVHIFDKEISKIVMDGKLTITPEVMFNQLDTGHHYIWRFNNMNLAKTLRQIIPRPKVVPKFGQSTERYLVIDSGQNSFKLPDTECSFSFIVALSGSRAVNLVPAEECKHQCKVLNVDLKQSVLLWYNWWYWRPTIGPSQDNSTFIGHIGSYC